MQACAHAHDRNRSEADLKVITFANVKGGVGKTTATIMTALALSRRGYRVIVKDLDPWGSAYDWSSRAEEAGTPLPFPVRTAISGTSSTRRTHATATSSLSTRPRTSATP